MARFPVLLILLCCLRIMQENKNRGVAKRWLGVVAILALIAAIVGWYAHYSSRDNGAPIDKAFVRKLETKAL